MTCQFHYNLSNYNHSHANDRCASHICVYILGFGLLLVGNNEKQIWPWSQVSRNCRMAIETKLSDTHINDITWRPCNRWDPQPRIMLNMRITSAENIQYFNGFATARNMSDFAECSVDVMLMSWSCKLLHGLAHLQAWVNITNCRNTMANLSERKMQKHADGCIPWRRREVIQA
jgi:hypothetical protein